MKTGTEIIHLQLSVADVGILNDRAQDVVVEIKFDYTHTPPVKGGETANLHIELTDFWLTFKKDITDEKPTLVELPIEFFNAAMLDYFKFCIAENFDALAQDYANHPEQDNS